jgi:hypothetical protein
MHHGQGWQGIPGGSPALWGGKSSLEGRDKQGRQNMAQKLGTRIQEEESRKMDRSQCS